MPVICGSGGSWVDVRDCALAHVLSLEKSAAGGERMIIASPGMFTFKKILYFFFFPSYCPIDHWVWQDWGMFRKRQSKFNLIIF